MHVWMLGWFCVGVGLVFGGGQGIVDRATQNTSGEAKRKGLGMREKRAPAETKQGLGSPLKRLIARGHVFKEGWGGVGGGGQCYLSSCHLWALALSLFLSRVSLW